MTSPEQSYREIPLTKGRFAIVDASDFDYLTQWRWEARLLHNCDKYYAVRRVRRNKRAELVYMHRQLLGLCRYDGVIGDHRNGHSLDNRRDNLRVTNRLGNSQNARKRKGTASPFKGVTLYKPTGKFRARIKANGKEISLGYFRTEEEAYQAYRDAAPQYHGEYANIAPPAKPEAAK